MISWLGKSHLMAFPRKPRRRDENKSTEDCLAQGLKSGFDFAEEHFTNGEKLERVKHHFESGTKLKETEDWIDKISFLLESRPLY